MTTMTPDHGRCVNPVCDLCIQRIRARHDVTVVRLITRDGVRRVRDLRTGRFTSA